MKKKKRKKKSQDSKSISKKILSSIQYVLKEKVVDITEWRNAKIAAEDYEKTVVSDDQLSKMDPAHGAYTYGQNKLSVFVEQLAQLPELVKHNNAYADAEEEYMPSGPPMSPLTYSYFSCWGFLDLCVGPKKETFCSLTIDLCKFIGVDPGLISIFEKMGASRMGFYVHQGSSGEFVFLRELITGKEIEAVVPSGYNGSKGEIWFVRVMPPPFDSNPFDHCVVFTTPYVVGELPDKYRFLPGREDSWLEFFERNLKKAARGDKISAYESLMKYGLDKNYWNEYIFLAYVTHQEGMISLAGFPDIPGSLPHWFGGLKMSTEQKVYVGGC